MTSISRIEDFCVTGTGGTPSRDRAERYFVGGTIPWVKSGELRECVINESEEHVTKAALDETNLKLIPAGALLLAMYGATVGRLGILGVPATTNQAVCHIIPDPKCADTRYLFYSLQTCVPVLLSRRVGGAQPNISQSIVRGLEVHLPSLPEQRRIAEVLDRAETLRARRRAALAQLDSLTQSIFLELFGDPAVNPKGWPWQTLGSLATNFSDGPFGSNLKSEHYTEDGVRVVRLQNIGVGEFLDEDKAYVSELHFAKLKKHACMPGDVLVGTLGDPNLRACIQPAWLPIALNKADCVQIRPNHHLATGAFICALLNQPTAALMAHALMHGQTRIRISMGKLRCMEVPVPPISLQREFAKRVAAVEKLKTAQRASLAELDALFASLQHRAFRGEL